MSDEAIASDSGSSSARGATASGLESVEDDRALVQAIAAGDARAFERLVRAHVDPLRAVALRLLQNQADADEVVQEAFLSAFRNLPSWRGDARLGTWLHRIVVNAALQRLRRRKRLGTASESVEELLPRFLDDGHPEHFHRPWVQTAEELATRAETREQVRRVIDKLPENYRTVLILRDIEELDTAEVADLLELSPGAVKVRLHRARQALRNLLEHEFELTQQA